MLVQPVNRLACNCVKIGSEEESVWLVPNATVVQSRAPSRARQFWAEQDDADRFLIPQRVRSGEAGHDPERPGERAVLPVGRWRGRIPAFYREPSDRGGSDAQFRPGRPGAPGQFVAQAREDRK